jgi:hypothetical protein
MGAIMCIGVATSNSILVVTFANEQLRTGKNPFEGMYAHPPINRHRRSQRGEAATTGHANSQKEAKRRL